VELDGIAGHADILAGRLAPEDERPGYSTLTPNREEMRMHARVSTYRGDADRLIEGFQGPTEALEQMDGFSHAYFLFDREGGKAMSITIWESEEALNASVAKADELRQQGTQAGGGSIESVEHYEIGLTAGRAS
jgi:heme-degrading monooxygenase HmoA